MSVVTFPAISSNQLSFALESRHLILGANDSEAKDFLAFKFNP